MPPLARPNHLAAAMAQPAALLSLLLLLLAVGSALAASVPDPAAAAIHAAGQAQQQQHHHHHHQAAAAAAAVAAAAGSKQQTAGHAAATQSPADKQQQQESKDLQPQKQQEQQQEQQKEQQTLKSTQHQEAKSTQHQEQSQQPEHKLPAKQQQQQQQPQPAKAASAGPEPQRSLQQQQQQQQQQAAAAAAAASTSPAAAAAPGTQGAPLPEIHIPRPAPGVYVPLEPAVPLYSPDQLRLRHPIYPDAPLEGQVISIVEQMQQAAALGESLTKEQLETAGPLLGRHGKLKIPPKARPEDWGDGYLALCAIVKDQHKDLREWLEYHAWLGVAKIYIYDNNSTVPLAADIADFLHSGFVEYAFFIGQPRYRDLFRTSSQWWAYNDCISRFSHRHRWLGFIDADEFIVLTDTSAGNGSSHTPGSSPASASPASASTGAAAGAPAAASTAAASEPPRPDINAFMSGYEAYGGLAINWAVFGSSGHKGRPHGGVLVNYWACLPWAQEQNGHVKVIANTAHLLTVGDDPHRVYYRDDAITVNELRQTVEGAKSPPSHTRIALYHYLTKSEGEYTQKMKRGSAAGNYKSPEFFTTINAFATANCTAAMPLGLACCPSVRKELGEAGIQRVTAAIAAAKQQQQQQLKTEEQQPAGSTKHEKPQPQPHPEAKAAASKPGAGSAAAAASKPQ